MKKLLLMTVMLGILTFQLNAQDYVNSSGIRAKIQPPEVENTGGARVDCQNNNGYTITTTGSTTDPNSTPTSTVVCSAPPAGVMNPGLWTGFSTAGFVTYTFSPAICSATISYSNVNGPNGTGLDVGQIGIDAGTMTLSNPCGVTIAGSLLTCNLTGPTSNPFGVVNITVTSTAPFTTITLRNVGGESGWVQGDPCQFIIQDCCTAPIPDAILVDQYGNETKTFCYMEDIYLDASASTNYDEYFMSVWEFDDFGNTINYSRFEPWWKPGPVPNPFNISAYPWFPSTDWMFCPGGNYRIQFALRNDCDGWENIDLDFNVECCDFTADATFELIIPSSNGNTYTMEAVNYEEYPDSPVDCPITHSWCVYEKDVKGDGSLTYLTTVFGPDFTYTGQDGIHYTVVHRVKSPCGDDDCYAVEIFRDAFGLRSGNDYVAERVDCPEDCDPDCEAPVGLTCAVDHGQHLLSWDDVIGATSYIVEITFNDPDCCHAINPTQFRYYPVDNWVYIPIQTDKCWSWRVLTICGDESSDWSEKICTPRGSTCSESPCETPTNLSCRESEGEMVLSWDPVSAATSYIVEITFNDPDCCEEKFPTQFRYYPTTNSVNIPIQTEKCWSWSVQTICGDDRSDWSQKICMALGIRCFSDSGHERGEESEYMVNQPISLNAYPNPFDDIIHFELSLTNDIQHLSMMDLLGRVIIDKDINPLTTKFELNTGSLIPGIYYAALKQSDGEVVTIKIVKR